MTKHNSVISAAMATACFALGMRRASRVIVTRARMCHRSDLTDRRETVRTLSDPVTRFPDGNVLHDLVVEGHDIAALDLIDLSIEPQPAAR